MPAHLARGVGLDRFDQQPVVLQDSHRQEAHVACAQDVWLLAEGGSAPDGDLGALAIGGGQGRHVLAVARHRDVADQREPPEILRRGRGRGGRSGRYARRHDEPCERAERGETMH